MSETTLTISARRARPRPGQECTRHHVLETVYDLISEHGIEGLSMRQVADAAGLSTGTINYHFGNKQSLVIAALESAYELPSDWEQYCGSPSAQLRRLVFGYVCRSPRDRFWRFWINYLAASTRNDELSAHQRTRYERQERFWARLIRDAVKVEEFKKSLDPQHEAEQLLSLAHGLLVRQLVLPYAEVRAEARALLGARIDSFRE
ncbi:AcrR family transcriptional regulator [Variovorax paradoxus]|jgi:AcrR family transcriptional regulator|uniref:AcrR family transcriptional regulator n=1 Tax=Variovorax paradoxus TaxID=34073 RepID=A0AAW8ESE2_VARPD|nr:TetR/AcrR family transcriptional regulator [Variovorax paradoxus]MDP9974857.1 AcrR family transcriptional regulator [Variovorax paradoxus]